jgi:hypothetical protein
MKLVKLVSMREALERAAPILAACSAVTVGVHGESS